MPVEVANNFEQLDKTQPLIGDGLNETGAHLRQLKQVLKNMFPGAAGQGYADVIDATEDEIDSTIGLTTNVQNELDDIISNGVIVSGFIPYSGLFASIPVGWQLCDGTNGTPNLADTFIYGTSTQSEIGNTGGSADSQVINHSHTMNHGHSATLTGVGDHIHDILSGGASNTFAGLTNWSNNTNIRSTEVLGSAGSHDHPVTTDTASLTTTSTGVSGVGANNPAYIRLAYIMRVS